MSAGRRLSKEQRQEAELDLSHWGAVARRRWRAEPKTRHPLIKALEGGMSVGPVKYITYDYEPDEWFKQANLRVMSLPDESRVVLMLHYIDRKPWKVIRKMMDFEHWWQVGTALKSAELLYLLRKEHEGLANTTRNAMIS